MSQSDDHAAQRGTAIAAITPEMIAAAFAAALKPFAERRGRSLMTAINTLHAQWKSDGRPHRFDPLP